jgi:hypothetical protein
VIGRVIASTAAALALAAAGTQVAIGGAQVPVVPTAARSAAVPIAARTARTLTVNDTGHLELLHASGEILIEEGPVSGTLPGSAKVRLKVGTTVRATFTIKPNGGGSIIGTGRAALHSSGRYSSFGGTLTVTGGTGRYAHAHGSGKLYGVIERKSDNLTVQTREGTLHY